MKKEKKRKRRVSLWLSKVRSIKETIALENSGFTMVSACSAVSEAASSPAAKSSVSLLPEPSSDALKS